MYKQLRFFSCLGWLFWSATCFASDSLNLSIGQWSFDDIHAQNLNFDVVLTSKGFGLIAHADTIQLASPIGRITNIKLRCDELLLMSAQFSCVSGQIAFQQHDLGQQKLAFNITGKPDNNQYQIKITGLNLASAQLVVEADIKQEDWQVAISSPKAALTSLIKFLSPYMQDEQIQNLAGWSVDGDLKLSAQMKGQADTFTNLTMELIGTAVNISDAQGQYVTEDIATEFSLDLNKQKQTWQWKSKFTIDGGQGYGEPIFIDFNTTPINFNAKGFWQQDNGYLQVEEAKFTHNNVMQAGGSFKGSLDQIEQLDLTIEKSELALLYQNWLQPFVVGTAVDNIELTGEVALNYHQQADDYHFSLTLDKVFVDDESNRFGLDKVTGTLGWTNYKNPMLSDLSWQGGHVYDFPLGASRVRSQAESSSLALLAPWALPILDGELQINNFKLHWPEGEESTWSFDGLLTPVSMESLSSALGWPLLRGKLSGVIPNVSYVDQNIQVDGALLVKLFEGTTIIRNLELGKPFGSLPQLYANVDLIGLNLETLTQTFDFGKITGKLDGKVNNLRLSNWQPVQFDASFATPEGDKSRRRISQKAVDNLSQIGGGAGGVLSRSFLRFFEDFSYQRLGLSCKLVNEVCEMSGVGKAEQGYYIVKGGGLPPRINVVGYTRRVDWPDLIERLKAVSQSSGPVVQ
jgi:hypothetical protein